MSSASEMDNLELLRAALAALRAEHRDLDEAIAALQSSRPQEQLSLRRLKKQKLVLKDRIAAIEDVLLPDIIA